MGIGFKSDELIKKSFMVWVVVANFVSGLYEHWLDKKMGWRVVFGIEEKIKLFWEDPFEVALQVPFGMIDLRNISVCTEKFEDDLAEGDDIYWKLGILFSQAADKGRE